MRKILISSFITLFFIISLTGCNSNQLQDKNSSANQRLSENSFIKKNDRISNSNYNLNKLKSEQTKNPRNDINSRLDNGDEFIKTFNILKTSALKNDKKTISDYINYPLTVYINGTKTKISNEAEFIKYYDNIFNLKIKNSLKDQELANLKITPDGIIVGKGEIRLNLINNGKHEYGIYSINNK